LPRISRVHTVTRMKPRVALVAAGILGLGLTVQSAAAAPVLGAARAAAGSSAIAASDGTTPKQPAERVVPEPKAAPISTQAIGGGYIFVPINPYRSFDSRLIGPLPGGYVDRFSVLTDIYGVQRIPDDAVAVTYNLTVTDTMGSGFAAIYPIDIDWPGNSSINWTAPGTTVANGGTVAIGNFLSVTGGVEVYIGPDLDSVGTHYLIDITGYYV
jgi:hypothetical protein